MQLRRQLHQCARDCTWWGSGHTNASLDRLAWRALPPVTCVAVDREVPWVRAGVSGGTLGTSWGIVTPYCGGRHPFLLWYPYSKGGSVVPSSRQVTARGCPVCVRTRPCGIAWLYVFLGGYVANSFCKYGRGGRGWLGYRLFFSFVHPSLFFLPPFHKFLPFFLLFPVRRSFFLALVNSRLMLTSELRRNTIIRYIVKTICII